MGKESLRYLLFLGTALLFILPLAYSSDRVIEDKHFEELKLINPSETLKDAKVRATLRLPFIIIFHSEGVLNAKPDRFPKELLEELNYYSEERAEYKKESAEYWEKQKNKEEERMGEGQKTVSRNELLKHVSSKCFMDYSIDQSGKYLIGKSPTVDVYYKYPLDNTTLDERTSSGNNYTKVVVFSTKNGKDDILRYKNGRLDGRENSNVDSVNMDQGVEVRKAFLAIINNSDLKSGTIDLTDKRSNPGENLNGYLQRMSTQLVGVYRHSNRNLPFQELGGDVIEFPVAVYLKNQDFYYAHIAEQDRERYAIASEWKIDLSDGRFEHPLSDGDYFRIKESGLHLYNQDLGQLAIFEPIK